MSTTTDSLESVPLNAKQARFVEEYLKDLNATQAAIRAGYSEKTAYSQGQRLLKHAEVAKSIQKAMDKRSEKTGITAEVILEELAKVGMTSLTDLIEFDEKGVTKIKASKDLTSAQRACISEVTQHTNIRGDTTFKFKTYDKLRALELAGKHVNVQAFKDKVEVEGKLTLEDLVTQSRGDE